MRLLSSVFLKTYILLLTESESCAIIPLSKTIGKDFNRCAHCLFSVTTICRVCNRSYHRFAVLERMQTLFCRVRETQFFYCFCSPYTFCVWGNFFEGVIVCGKQILSVKMGSFCEKN